MPNRQARLPAPLEPLIRMNSSASLARDGRSVCGWKKDLAEKARRAVLNLGEVGHLHQAALRCEGKRPLAALNLGDPEDLMIAGILGGNLAPIVDHQATGFGENCVSEVVLAPHRCRVAQPVRPPGRRRRLRPAASEQSTLINSEIFVQTALMSADLTPEKQRSNASSSCSSCAFKQEGRIEFGLAEAVAARWRRGWPCVLLGPCARPDCPRSRCPRPQGALSM
jgi:hypothetical protein